MARRENGAEFAKGLVNDIAAGYRQAVEEDAKLDRYQKANARLGIAVGQVLANLVVDAIAEWNEDD